MSTIYSFNSKAKTMVRVETYGWILRTIGEERFLSSYHIVIASRECDDIDFLLLMGVPPSHIIACDLDVVARNLAKSYGVVLSPHPSIEETVPWAVATYGEKNIASINVDLCSPLRSRGRPNGAEVLREVLSETPLQTTVIFTFYRSRDGFYDSPGALGKRLRYLRRIIGNGEVIQKAFPYQSRTPNRPVGSPFCTLILSTRTIKSKEDTMSKTTKTTTTKTVKKTAPKTTKTVKKTAPKVAPKPVKKTVSKKGSYAATKAWKTRKANAKKKSK